MPPSPVPEPLPESGVTLRCDPGTSTGAAFRELLRELAERILLHRRRVLASADPEALHDFRVASRRSRSLVSDLRGAIADPDRRRIGGELARLARATNPLRDLDVFAESLRADAGSPVELVEWVEAQAAAARRIVVDGLAPEPIESWLRGLLALDAPAGEAADEPIERVARRAIARAWERFERAGSAAATSGRDEEIHRLRIRGKRLRYSLEFFDVLVRDYPAPLPDLAALRAFQDLLGAHNDLVSQAAILGRARRELSPAGRLAVEALEERTERQRRGGRAVILAGWPLPETPVARDNDA